MAFDPSQPRDDHGRWGGGGSGALASAGAAISGGMKQAADWVASGGAQRAIASVLTESNVKTAVALSIKSALYHLGNLDDPAMEIVEPVVHDMVHNIREHLSVSTGRAREMAMAAGRALIDARRKQISVGI